VWRPGCQGARGREVQGQAAARRRRWVVARRGLAAWRPAPCGCPAGTWQRGGAGCRAAQQRATHRLLHLVHRALVHLVSPTGRAASSPGGPSCEERGGGGRAELRRLWQCARPARGGVGCWRRAPSRRRLVPVAAA
jgi:hypothetical protein